MKLDDYVAVSGMPGLYKLVANRNNGLIVEDLDSGKRKFAAARKHQFTPLASIGIYNDDDTIELVEVFRKIYDQKESNPPIKPNSSADELRDYFTSILPDHDQDRVHTGDIKKVIKWFGFLNERNLFDWEAYDKEQAESNKEEEKKETEVKEDKD